MRKFLVGSLLIALVLSVVGCASAPKATEPAAKPAEAAPKSAEAAPKGVDLVITGVKVMPEGKVLADSKFTFEVTVKNIGTEDMPATVKDATVEIYEGKQVAAFTGKIPSLKAGAEAVLKLDDFAGGVAKLTYKAAGDHKYVAKLDPSNNLAEVNKQNNQLEFAVKVEPKEETKK